MSPIHPRGSPSSSAEQPIWSEGWSAGYSVGGAEFWASLPEASAEASERYRIGPRLGQGGFAEVFLARDNFLGRDVALKVAKDSAHRASLGLEARIAGALHHPSLVPIYDAGTLPDGRPYLSMPVLAGGTLWDRAPHIPLRDAVEIVARITWAIDALHAQEIAHGDPSPANILLGARGEVWLIDLGIASRGGTGPSGGTPDFIDPDRRGPATPESDVYSVGAILGWVLRARGEPEPRELRSLVRAATHRDPLHRPTAGLLARELERWLSGAELALHSYGPVERVGRFIRLHGRRLAPVVVATAAGLAAAGALGGWSLVERARRVEAHRVMDAARAESILREVGDPGEARDLARRSLAVRSDPDVLGLLYAASSLPRLTFAPAGPGGPCRTLLCANDGTFRVELSLERPRTLLAHDGERRLWSVPFFDPSEQMYPGAMLVDGDRVLVAHGSLLYVLDRATGAVRERAPQPVRSDDLAVIGFVREDRTLQLGNRRGDLWRVDLESAQTVEVRERAGPNGSLRLAGPASGAWLAVAGEDQPGVHFLADGALASAMEVCCRVRLFAADPDRLAVATDDGIVRVYTGLAERRWPSAGDAVAAGPWPSDAWRLTWDGDDLVAETQAGQARARVALPRRRALHRSLTYAMVIHPADGSVWTAATDETVAQWDPATNRVSRWPLPDRPRALVPVAKGEVLAATEHGELWRLGGEPQRLDWPGATSPYSIVVGHGLLVAVGPSAEVKAWRWPGLTPAWSAAPGVIASWMQVAATPSGFVAVNLDRTVWRFDAEGRHTKVVDLPEGAGSVCVRPAGLAVGGRNGTLFLVDDEGQFERRDAHGDWIHAITCDEDGGFSTSSEDGALAVWDPEGALVARWRASNSPLWSVAWTSPPGQRDEGLASLSGDGSVVLWSVPRPAR